MFAGCRTISLGEGVENSSLGFLGNARPGVANFEFQFALRLSDFFADPHPDDDFALLRELHRVAD